MVLYYILRPYDQVKPKFIVKGTSGQPSCYRRGCSACAFFFWQQGNGNISFQFATYCSKSLILKELTFFKNGRMQNLGEYHKSATNYTNYTKKLWQIRGKKFRVIQHSTNL